jgi:Uma2 family endonuclease
MLGPMRAPAFLDWAAAQPAGRFELIDGYVSRLPALPPAAARAAADAARSFAMALRRAGVAGRVFPGGGPVLVDEATVLSPDLIVGVGGSLRAGGVETDAPLIVLEAAPRPPLTPEARAARYLRAPGVAHAVTVDAAARSAVCRRLGADGRLETFERRAGAMTFDPPGLQLSIEDLFLTR